ncbi:MAG: Hsp20/alpha crystallin family protein [Sphingobacteriales bacterium]|nr:MAG: Hsp20/alpha crystallin family protein [Sphingobacteriales bacterium]
MTLVRPNYKPGYVNLNNLLDNFFSEAPSLFEKNSAAVAAVNIAETTEAYHLELNAPGRNKEDFAITIDNGLLTIGFENKEEAKTENYKTVRKEFSVQSFKRSFTIDENIDATGIQAKYENGLLKLLLPKKATVKEASKSITIQ